MILWLTTLPLLLVAIQIKGQTEMSDCGIIQPIPIPLMTRSEPTLIRWPWHSAIYHRLPEKVITYKCGGSLISRNSILTAAHCVSSKYGVRMKSKDILVSLGRLTLNESETGGRSYEVQQINVHPNFTWDDLNNDIAIIRLSVEVQFNRIVYPICLWKGKTDLSEIDGKFGTVVGWGRTESGQISNVLQQASLPVVSLGKCLESNRIFHGIFLTARNFCAGLRNGTSVCDGDSGGSMTFEENGIYSIRGIVSTTPLILNQTTRENICDSMEYVIFTDVAHYLLWIRNTATMQCETTLRCDSLSLPDICLVSLKIIEKTGEKCRIIFEDNISNNNITTLKFKGIAEDILDVSHAVHIFKNLEKLDFNEIKLKTVKLARLTDFRKIKMLILSFNEIARLDADTFDNLTNLSELNLDSNNLTELHTDLLAALPNLRSLFLSSNQLETLPPSVFRNNKKIEKLSLQKNRLIKLDVHLFEGLENLEELYLYKNKIEILPVDIFHDNREMRKLDLSQNQLKVLHSDNFKMLRKLKVIHLHGNQLENIDDDLFIHNEELTDIDIKNNNIKKLKYNLDTVYNSGSYPTTFSF